MNNAKNPWRTAARILLGVIVAFWGIFAFISGATEPGLIGVLKNSPNAIPFALLGLLYYWAWKKPFSGGIAVMVLGFLMFILFRMYRIFSGDFEPLGVILAIFLPVEIAGVLFILASKKSRQH